jgi:DNA-binding beta-propeller fold protein YncE
MIGFKTAAPAALALAVLALALAAPAHADDGRDRLVVGDGVDNKVEVFDAETGAYRRSLAPTGLLGPRGIVERFGSLFLVNQNVDTDFTGEVFRFNARTGTPVTRVVPADTEHAPFAPRGMVLWRGHLFVANVLDPTKEGLPGGINKYTAAGAFVETLAPPPGPAEFHPFGVVIGPDGLLYVSSRPTLFTTGLGGQVLRFNPTTGDYVDTFISNGTGSDGGCTDALNGPEGLAFGPDGRLYITSFRADENDTDKILVFAGPRGARPGRCVATFDLDKVGAKRATAAAILFGPGGDLFVPITNAFSPDDIGKDRGAVRRYRVTCRQTATRTCFSYFIRKGGELGQGWYLTFGRTNPGTLAYGD